MGGLGNGISRGPAFALAGDGQSVRSAPSVLLPVPRVSQALRILTGSIFTAAVCASGPEDIQPAEEGKATLTYYHLEVIFLSSGHSISNLTSEGQNPASGKWDSTSFFSISLFRKPTEAQRHLADPRVVLLICIWPLKAKRRTLHCKQD